MVTVSGKFLLADDVPDTGVVSFAPLVLAVDETPDDRFVTTTPVACRLDASGAFTVDLVASDDTGWMLDPDTMTNGGMPYRVVMALSSDRHVFTAYLPAPGPWDLSELIALDAPPDVAVTPGGGGGAGIAEAPTDGQQYARQDGGWQIVQVAGSAAVYSVNTQTGDVVLDAGDVGADPAGTATAAVAVHTAAADPHPQYLTTTEADGLYATPDAIPAPSGSLPTDADTSAGVSGQSALYSRADHRHHIPTAAASALGPNPQQGNAATLARSDHVHPYPSAGQVGAYTTAETDTLLASMDSVKADTAYVDDQIATLSEAITGAVLVLDPAELVPDGTAVDTVIVRR